MYERDSGGSGVSARSVRPFHRAGPLAGVHTALGLAGSGSLGRQLNITGLV